MEEGPFIHAFVWLVVVPLLLAALTQIGAANSAMARRMSTAVGRLPVPATAVALFGVLAAVVPQLGPASAAALRVVPVYVAFAVIGAMPMLPAVIVTQTLVELSSEPVYVRVIGGLPSSASNRRL